MQVALRACAAWGGVTIIHWVLLHPRCGYNTTKRQRSEDHSNKNRIIDGSIQQKPLLL